MPGAALSHPVKGAIPLLRIVARAIWKRKILSLLVAAVGTVGLRRILQWYRRRLALASPNLSERPEPVHPEDVSLYSEVLDKMVEHINKTYIAGDRLPGAVLIVVRRGELVLFETLGEYDENTIFRLYQMSSIFTAMAVMQFAERGVLNLTDPLTKWLPDCPPLVVQRYTEDPRPVKRPPMIKECLVHTAGFSCCYPWVHPEQLRRPAEAGRADYLRDDVVQADNLDEIVAQETSVPLLFQPGDHYNQSSVHVLLGKVVEACSRMGIDEYLYRNLFEPLKMRSTGFSLPEEDTYLLAEECWYLNVARSLPEFFGGFKGFLLKICIAFQRPQAFLSGQRYVVAPRALGELLWGKNIPLPDTGLYSTAVDMVQFLKMLSNWGRLPDDKGADLGVGKGSRVMSEETLRAMMVGQTNELVPPFALEATPETQRTQSVLDCSSRGEASGLYRDANSYPGQSACFGSFVVVDNPKRSGLPPRARGTVHSCGAASTYLFHNPFESLCGVVLSQVCDERSNMIFQDFVTECHKSL
eukprot:gnl/MRDRNA2_/MRDRNA2_25100_c0_seq1.p1 gnl/MRDRNA2_/MRDRNA2_25100_c0~~gnl/MRDRNA2_/MRDRNA2_25100_c0_seq1.p1  ORF type:complete len:527 (+),score=44.95 gnl/MRDRNA2_/MRDRNA2_25100_c0_seq1:135-1715(+)